MYPLHANGVQAIFDVSVNEEPPISILTTPSFNLTDSFKLVMTIPGEYRITGLDEISL